MEQFTESFKYYALHYQLQHHNFPNVYPLSKIPRILNVFVSANKDKTKNTIACEKKYSVMTLELHKFSSSNLLNGPKRT